MSRPSRRHLLAAAGPILAPVVLAACGPFQRTEAPGSSTTGQLKASAPLQFMSWGEPAVGEIFQRAAQQFTSRSPGVQVEYISSQGQNHLEKLQAMLAAGTPPAVFYLSPGDTPTFAHGKLIRPLDDLIKRDRYDSSDFFEKCLAQYFWKSKLYELPRGFGNQDVYYNTSMFDAGGLKSPPADWNDRGWTVDDFLDAALRLTRRSGSDVQVWGWHQGRGLRQWGPWVWAFGGEVLNKDGTRCLLDQPAALEGLQFLQNLIHRHRVMPPPDVRLNSIQAMGSGQLAMAMGIPANLNDYRALPGLAFDVAPLARKAIRVTSGGGVAWAMAQAIRDVDAAWELHKWIVSKNVQITECEAGVVAPPRKSVLRSPCYVDRTRPPKSIDVFLQAPDFVHPDPQALGWTDAEAEINTGLGALWTGEKTARQIAQDLVPRVNQLLRERAG